MSERDEHIKRIVERAQADKASSGAPMRVRRPSPPPSDERRRASAPPTSGARRPAASSPAAKGRPAPPPAAKGRPAPPPARKKTGAPRNIDAKYAAPPTSGAKTETPPPQPKERRHFIWAGLAFVFLGGFLLLAGVSYLRNWAPDHSIAHWSSLLTEPNRETMNMCGRLGAIVSQEIIGRWFGIFGLLMGPIMWIIAAKLFRPRGLRTRKWLRSALTIMVVGSVAAGHFGGMNANFFGSGPGGEMGIYAAQWLGAIVGYEGTTLLIVVTGIATLYFINARWIYSAYGAMKEYARRAKKRAAQRAEMQRLREAELAEKREIERRRLLYNLSQNNTIYNSGAQTPTPETPAPTTDITAPEAETAASATPEPEVAITPTPTTEPAAEMAIATPEVAPAAKTTIETPAAEPVAAVAPAPKPTLITDVTALDNGQWAVVTARDEWGVTGYYYLDAAAIAAEGVTNILPPTPEPVATVTADDEPEEELELVDHAPEPVAAPIEPEKPEELEDDGPRLTIQRPHDADEADEPAPEIIVEQVADEKLVTDDAINASDLYDPTLELRSYKKPPIELLQDHALRVTVTDEELMENKHRIVHTLETFGIKIASIEATIGPTVTLYEIIPAPGVRISKIKNLEDDIALSLSALGIRIIAPIPGKGTIGIEVPNKDKEIVSMYSVIKSAKFQESKADLPVALGKTIQNETFVLDLAKMPHLLVAGATGQGKSVGLNAIITSLLYKKHPAELKFVLVDPKKVELTLYSRLENHFLAKLPDADESIITDTQKVIYTLNSICIEMDARYDLLKEAGVRGIKEYNEKFTRRRLNPEKGHRYLPYFVVVIDEFADLIMTAGREVETPIARIAQLARAVGIHLIIATQRPTTNIITGVIKANFPARIAFRVTSQIDSRTILDGSGANQLIGRGDMLISTGSDLTRVQCAFVDTPEVEAICGHIAAQRGYEGPYLLPDYQPEGGDEGRGSREDMGKRDPLFDDVAYYVVSNQVGSASTIQRKFSIGFNRAGRIVDQLEAAGVVGPSQGGSKPRQVLISDPLTLEHIISQ